MARRTKSTPATPQARDLALAIRQGERKGLTQKQIAATLGINPRTVRKVKSGQTSGRRTYERLTRRPKIRATPNAFNAEFVIGYDADGQPIIGSANIIVPDIRTRDGGRRAPTALDVFRLPDLAAVADAERRRLARQYASSLRAPEDDDICRRESCGHPASEHIGDGNLFPCLRGDGCADFLDAPSTVRLRSIGGMRKAATAIIRTGV